MKLILILLLGLVYQTNGEYYVTPDCLDGWILYNGHCYLFSNFDDVQLPQSNQTEAEDVCTSLGGHLTSILDQAEQNFIVQEIDDNGGAIDKSWYIGLTDKQTEGVYVWSDGYQSFFDDLTTNVSNSDNIDCVAYNGSAGLKSWYPVLCSIKLNFICKRLVGRYSPVKENPCTGAIKSAVKAFCDEFDNKGTHRHPWADGWYIVCPTETPTCMPCPYWSNTDGSRDMLVYNPFCDQCVALANQDSQDICPSTTSTTTKASSCNGCPTTTCDTNGGFYKNDADNTTYCQCVFKNYMCRPCPPGTTWNDVNKCCQ